MQNSDSPLRAHWRIFADTGGTFTDCLAISPDGAWHRAKVLSSGVLRTNMAGSAPWRVGLPEGFLDGVTSQIEGEMVTYSPGLEAPLVAAHLVTKTPFSQPLPNLELRLGTTRGTNALLTRTGTPPVFFVTAGFEDLLRIGNQARPDLFALDIVKPVPLYAESVGVSERLSADGLVLRPLDEAALRTRATRVYESGYRTAAVALLHSWRNPAHEQRVAEILRECGFTHVSLSSELAALQKLLPRAETAVVNAYLTPVLTHYLDGVRRGLSAASTLTIMTSTGGLVPDSQFRPKDSLLSGPAGGVVGACESGMRAGFTKLIAFDMGGTSTDVARIAPTGSSLAISPDNRGEIPEIPYVFEHKVGDAQLLAPAVAVESVAAGGGSICGCDDHGRLFVGPASAGAQPGPACYGAGGPLTITDINLLLGHIPEKDFSLPLSRTAAENALQAVAEKSGQSADALLHAFYDLANEAMADAIRQISVRKGYDPTEHALVAFGGAGGQHACALAEKLGIRTILIPPDQSLLSAFGIAHARHERFAERQVLRLLTQTDVSAILAELETEALNALGEAGEVTRRIARLRLLGQETPLEVPVISALADAFCEHFTQLYGYAPDPSRAIELESLRVVVARTHPASLVPRSATLPLRRRVEGGLIVEAFSVTVVRDGWTETTSESGALILHQKTPLLSRYREEGQGEEGVGALELFTRRFESVATEMGEALRRTALSVNVKERLDYSCALLGPSGNLVATAAHIPVHLGALGVCVRELIRADAFVGEQPIIVNHPAFGGSHLPDVTVVSPVYSPSFVEGRGQGMGSGLLGYVASRAHHAEIGGTRPGSMPPGAKTLVEEGVVIPPTPWDREKIMALLTNAPYPTRALADNLADLEAQLAANHQGAKALRALAEQHGPEKLFALQAALADRCEQIAREAISPGSFLATPSSPHAPSSREEGQPNPLPSEVRAPQEEGRRSRGDGPNTREMAQRIGAGMLDDGHEIHVALRHNASTNKLIVDFTGTSPKHPANFNTPPAVTVACVLFVLRLLIGEDVPLNEGLLRAVEIVLPPDTLLNPTFHADPMLCPAVVAGNTEVSQKVVAVLLQAFGLSAGSQATMNNTLFGNAHFGYYETVCGGAGATATATGASAVHTHMTNTRITDPEIIEARYPVRLERFEIRKGSGGAGKHPGGDGIVREYVFLEPVQVSLLTQSRTTGGFGANGGSDGAPGQQYLVRADGSVETLPGVAAAECTAGDRLILETPGGGGYGKQ
ncbi:hydantoinase B/oxoprolinase family protein [Armatimonas sp.]|uniref:hydantoinase B/oxoprolinase family protein n=1 Tax=Armatimonas sp. TaxID=1872638 RepID=UPI00286CFA0A|nr:hydantoinase B/oxoprolinase family protein [Armatimonas sp.]